VSYRFLIDNTNRIHSLLSDAEADADVYPEQARDYRIKAAFLACDTFNRLLYDADFEQSLETCRREFFKHREPTVQFLTNTTDDYSMLRGFLNAEQRILIVAGMNKDAAADLLRPKKVRSVLDGAGPDFAADPLARERVLNALRIRQEETCSFAKSLQDERIKAEAQKQAEAEQQKQKQRNRRFKRRILNGIGGATCVTLNPTVGAGLFVISGGAAAVVSASLIALSGTVGSALINESLQQQL
jgi:hypothetical protein